MTPIFLFLLIIVVSITVYLYVSSAQPKASCHRPVEAFDNGNQVPDVEFPFKNIRDDKGQKLNIIAISAPFREAKHELLYESYKSAGLGFMGLSSYLNFPNKIDNPFEDRYHEERNHDYLSMVSSWVHCFRDPGNKLQYSGLPLLLLTEADLKDPAQYTPDTTIKKEFDFMYVCLDDNDKCDPGWNWYNRNFDLAKQCLPVMCGEKGMTGVIVGRTNCELPPECEGKITQMGFLAFHEFQKEMQKARILFVPNVADASPRVITEAMLLNIPVLVNKNILGGWHNVVSGVTGEFFTSEYDIGQALDKIRDNYSQYTPRKWYEENRGLRVSGAKLAEFLKSNYPEINNPDVVYASI
jgi:hypothetical protein